MSKEDLERLKARQSALSREIEELEKKLGIVEKEARTQMPSTLPNTGRELEEIRRQLALALEELAALKKSAPVKESAPVKIPDPPSRPLPGPSDPVRKQGILPWL